MAKRIAYSLFGYAVCLHRYRFRAGFGLCGCLTFYHWIAGITPQSIGIVHHQLDDKWHQLAQKGRAITQLVAIDAAVPSGATVDQLVAQGIHPRQHDR